MQRDGLADGLRSLLTGDRVDHPVVQRDLVGRLHTLLSPPGRARLGRILRLVRSASVGQRTAVLNHHGLMTLIGTTLIPRHATAVASALLRGLLRWANPTGNDFYRYFAMGVGNLPASPATTMNCWESIMYAAYLVGAVSADYIRQFYLAALTDPNPTAAAYALLGWGPGLPTYDRAAGRIPRTGMLVFYQTGGAHPGHVAIYMGNGKVTSLWNEPRGIHRVQEIRIRDLPGTITFRDPPW
ncbi:MAG TPA: hypothetical protein VGX25_25195 [Actinophytocola sp.]|uniref:hypothetical protein n=1 Tax=Actinophytocola sp. TaxID=1872138 RepID=UPI002DDCFAD8|nr:hypothetical protein [Actinophytocola sp.]HEV2782701.1 hypothetical protein [Actinophytocola sp.]